jgi:hypothetical protein
LAKVSGTPSIFFMTSGRLPAQRVGMSAALKNDRIFVMGNARYTRNKLAELVRYR